MGESQARPRASAALVQPTAGREVVFITNAIGPASQWSQEVVESAEFSFTEADPVIVSEERRNSGRAVHPILALVSQQK